MNLSPESFDLQHSDVPQPRLLDGPVITDAPWPMPSTHPMPEEPVWVGFDLGRGEDTTVFITTGEQP